MKSLKYTQYDVKKESEILTFWEQKGIIDSIIERNKNGEKFYFLQGPPYTSGKIHCGHAWNHALKDAVLRYKRMKGYDVLARAGYDMHGLPTELKVQKQLNLNGKEDIETYGYEKFVKECITWSEEKSAVMDNDLKQLGITLDFSDSYKPISQEYMDSVWFLIKKADEKKRLYQGEKTMLWCPATESALAKHEVEYKVVKDTSIFLKFQKEGKENEFFIIWTTTPWTIPFNLAIMVNPSMEYVDCNVKTKEGKDEVWTVCKELANVFLSNVDDIEFEVGKPYAGNELEGQKYIHPWAELNPDIQEIQKNSPKLFSILLSEEYVDASAGTGLVHCAPGCGPEDYEVGLRNGLPPYNIIDEKGVFPEKIEKFAGLVAKTDDKQFIAMMKEDGFLIKKSPIEHEYPFSERGGVPVVFRTTKQWFFKIEDLKERMLEANDDIYWYPDMAKNAFNSWLDNIRDNSITKQRIWGTPAPIWIHKDEEGNVDEYYVISSRAELEELAGKENVPENLHKPWIDKVTFKSPKTGNVMRRIPDVLDVWIDAGCASWASLYYPQREDLFEKYFPADFIVEGKDQIRGWFNLLMVASMIAFDKPSFKNVTMHGFIADVDGVKMSKSLGNVISPEEIIEKTSVDTFRYYFGKTKAGEDISFSWEQLNLHHRHFSILWNVSKYLFDMIDNYKGDLKTVLEQGKKSCGMEEQYILSKTHSAIKEVTDHFENYRLDVIPSVISDLFLSMSRNYIQAVRDKSNGSDEEKASVIYALFESLFNTIKIFAPISPFITEMIFQNIKSCELIDISEESVHQVEWPSFDEDSIHKDIEEKFEVSLQIISGVLAAREKAQLNVRQPLAKSVVITKNDLMLGLDEAYFDMIKTQANCKEIDLVEEFDKLEYSVKANFKNLGSDFGQKTADMGTAINQLGKDEAHIMHESFAQGKTYDLNGETIKSYHVNFEISVSEPFVKADIPKAIVAIDTSLNDDLKAEGLARELTRRIQQERKELSLIKSDRVEVVIDSKEVFDKIKPYLDEVTDVCGIEGFELEDSVEGKSFDLKDNRFNMVVKKI